MYGGDATKIITIYYVWYRVQHKPNSYELVYYEVTTTHYNNTNHM